MTLNRDVTVVIPTIPDRRTYLRRARKSIDAQIEPPAAVLVEVDENGEGAASTRNRALEQVETTWVAFLDDDDEFMPNHLQVCLDAVEKSGADLVYPYPLFIGSRDTLAVLYEGILCYPYGVPFGEEQERYLREVGGFIPVTHLCRTELAKKVGGFPEPGEFVVPEGNVSGDCEDYGFLIRLLDAGAKFHHVPEITWKYNIHGNNTGGVSNG